MPKGEVRAREIAVELAKETNCHFMMVGASVYEEMLAQPVRMANNSSGSRPISRLP